VKFGNTDGTKQSNESVLTLGFINPMKKIGSSLQDKEE
jgi:hypothetical protein